MDAQWYSPPAVGKAEATCAIVAAKAIASSVPANQPTTTPPPPAALKPRWNDVMPPAKMQMMDSEIA